MTTGNPNDPFCDASDPDLVACYEFENDVGFGVVEDGSGYGNDGVASNADADDGVRGLALSTNGNSEVRIPNTADLELVSALTIELWVKAVRINLKTVGPDAPGTLLARAGLARAQFRAGRIDEGCATFGDIATVIAREQGRSPNLADARSGQGECALLRGEAEPAASLQREAADIAMESNAPPQTRATIQLHLANALWEVVPSRAHGV